MAASPMPRSGSGWVAKVPAQQRDLGVAAGGEDQPLQQVGEGDHASRLGSAAARARGLAPRRPRRRSRPGAAPGRGCRAGSMQWISASSRPCVTQTSGAPTSSTVAFSSSQSAWSEITSGNSTPRDLARWRTRIQPEASATTGSASRRAQRSVTAPAERARSRRSARRGRRRSRDGARRAPRPAARRRAQSGGQRAVQIDRPVPSGLAQQGDQPLALPERVAADDMGALGEQRDARQQPRRSRAPGGG